MGAEPSGEKDLYQKLGSDRRTTIANLLRKKTFGKGPRYSIPKVTNKLKSGGPS